MAQKGRGKPRAHAAQVAAEIAGVHIAQLSGGPRDGAGTQSQERHGVDRRVLQLAVARLGVQPPGVELDPLVPEAGHQLGARRVHVPHERPPRRREASPALRKPGERGRHEDAVVDHVGAQGDRLLDILEIDLRVLPRQAAHDVDVDKTDVRFSGGREGPLDRARTLRAPDRADDAVVKTLHPDRQPVHAAILEHGDLIRVQEFRVGFERHLGSRLQRESAVENAEEALDLSAGQKRRSASAEVKMPEGALGEERREDRRLVFQAVQIGFDVRLAVRFQNEEAAKRAFCLAERNMDVEADRAPPPQRPSPGGPNQLRGGRSLPKSHRGVIKDIAREIRRLDDLLRALVPAPLRRHARAPP